MKIFIITYCLGEYFSTIQFEFVSELPSMKEALSTFNKTICPAFIVRVREEYKK